MSNFADRVIQESVRLGSPVVAGLDPRPNLLSSSQETATNGSMRARSRAYEEWGEQVLDGLAGVVPAVKIQIAFYECLGLPGMRAYIRTARRARDRGLLVIGDVKRGDIGSTAEAYAEAHFGAAASSAGGDVDAVTLNPYLGRESLEPFLARCAEDGRGAFALVRTSNPSAPQIQDLQVDGRPVHEHVGALVDEWGIELRGTEGYSSLGAVVGATYPRELKELRERHPHLLILVPGYGAQGGTAEDVAGALDDRGAGLLIASSRGILRAYREAADQDQDPVSAIRAAAETMRDDIRAAFEARTT